MKIEIEGPRWRFWCAPNATVEERAHAAHAICRYLIDPPRSKAELRRVAVLAILNLYTGSRSGRAKELEQRFAAYLASGWLREADLETLPEPRSTERTLLHRLARLNEGRSLGRRQLDRIAGPVIHATRRASPE